VAFMSAEARKVPVAVRSEITRNSDDISKADLKFNIWRFESSQGSQPVPSLRSFSMRPKNVRHVRRLGEYSRVSIAGKSSAYPVARRV
jgi:hypothetical protein